MADGPGISPSVILRFRAPRFRHRRSDPTRSTTGFPTAISTSCNSSLTNLPPFSTNSPHRQQSPRCDTPSDSKTTVRSAFGHTAIRTRKRQLSTSRSRRCWQTESLNTSLRNSRSRSWWLGKRTVNDGYVWTTGASTIDEAATHPGNAPRPRPSDGIHHP
jgi:hypothetical protein